MEDSSCVAESPLNALANSSPRIYRATFSFTVEIKLRVGSKLCLRTTHSATAPPVQFNESWAPWMPKKRTWKLHVLEPSNQTPCRNVRLTHNLRLVSMRISTESFLCLHSQRQKCDRTHLILLRFIGQIHNDSTMWYRHSLLWNSNALHSIPGSFWSSRRLFCGVFASRSKIRIAGIFKV